MGFELYLAVLFRYQIVEISQHIDNHCTNLLIGWKTKYLRYRF